ncbi:MAG: hypothetical protein PHO89_08590 [Methylacidiphilaceae bacterium]|nr:hypothetical protein [Candidatus Methylacidiphilaceae bacterium]
MHLQEVRTRRGEKVYSSYVIRESYRVGKQVKTRLIANVTRLPEDVREVLAAALRKKPLVSLDVLQAQEALDYGGLAVLEEAWQRFGLDEVLSGVGSERKQRLLTDLPDEKSAGQSGKRKERKRSSQNINDYVLASYWWRPYCLVNPKPECTSTASGGPRMARPTSRFSCGNRSALRRDREPGRFFI